MLQLASSAECDSPQTSQIKTDKLSTRIGLGASLLHAVVTKLDEYSAPFSEGVSDESYYRPWVVAYPLYRLSKKKPQA